LVEKIFLRYIHQMNNQTPLSPRPWQLGQPTTSPLEPVFTTLAPAKLSQQDIYRILINTIIPRPIAFVSTQSKNGKNNLAPYSFFNAVSSNPATLMISIAVKPDGTIKDTLRNIEETGEFVVNSANHWLIDPLVYSAGSFPEDIDEMTLTGLTPLASEVVKAPRVKESAFHYECTLYNKLQIGDGSPGSCTMVVGKIERMHIAESIYNQGKVNPGDLAPIGRLGGISYTTIGDVFEIAIPKV
jgi:flavin reductase (DIM6/NTAB) family NADH-FMN oxidoreductase RutF